MIVGTDEVVNVFRGNGWRSDATPKRGLVIVACLLCAIATLGLVFVASDKAADAPKRAVVWVEWGFVLVFLALAFVPIGTRARAIGSLVALVALVVVAIVQWIGIPWYFITHLGLDNGIGG
jgi:hypothetical protein